MTAWPAGGNIAGTRKLYAKKRSSDSRPLHLLTVASQHRLGDCNSAITTLGYLLVCNYLCACVPGTEY